LLGERLADQSNEHGRKGGRCSEPSHGHPLWIWPAIVTRGTS
jgi:hypothetical protein